MPTIISRRRIAFFHPNIPVLSTGTSPKSPKYNDAVFTTKGNGELEDAPEWINKPLGVVKAKDGTVLQPPRDINQQNINTWKHHEEDGHIMEVDVKKGKASGLEEEAEARKAEAARKASESTEVAMKSGDELAAMKKNELLDHAEQAHPELKLDQKLTKEEIVAAITDAQVKKAQKDAAA